MTLDFLWFPTDKCLVDGSWEPPTEKKTLNLINPSNGEKLATVARSTTNDVNDAVLAAEKALSGAWGEKTALDRGRILNKMSHLVEKYADKLALIESFDVGKPLSQAKNDVTALARYLEFYGAASDKIHGITIPYRKDFTVLGVREKLGITAHIIPWNYPMQIIGRSVCASLAMGNACILKPSEEACLTALAFGEIAREAGLSDGALNIIPGIGSESGKALASHKNVDHISFTGSVKTGCLIQKFASANVTPTTLELGGKSPQIVFSDSNLERAIPFLVNSGIQNSGQTCSASSRILVQDTILKDVLNQMAKSYESLKVGPAFEDLDLGPIISKKQKNVISKFESMGSDLDLIAKGNFIKKINHQGFYKRPKLFKTEDHKHILAQEEIFGPIQVVIPFKDEEEAVEIANSTDYGLVASVWTENGSRQMRIANQVKAGQVFINNYGAGGGVELPFGGVGKSGHGREKGFEALYGFSQLKTIANFHG